MNIGSMDDIIKAMLTTKELAEKHQFPLSTIMKLQLVTEEACTNAWEYCLREGISTYMVIWNLTNTSFEIIVRQKGTVFPIVQVKDNQTGLRGRGLTLMMNIMDRIEVRDMGEYIELYMVKERENIGECI